MQTLPGRHIVLGVCGSIAAYKAILLLRQLTATGADVWPVLTRAACRFVGPDTFTALAGRPAHVAHDADSEAGNIAHVELAHRADAVVVAPATAHLMAQAAAGLCPDVLTSLLLATRAPVVMAPAMEEGMWQHPATVQAASLLSQRGVRLVAPHAGALASGRSGLGRMAEPAAILAEVGRALTPPTLAGRRLLVTAGPTREALDPARFLSNPATGRMGLAVAQAAQRRGASVLLVLGPSDLPLPAGLPVARVTSCAQMLAACQAEMEAGCDAFIMAAAPADWRAASPAEHKLHKHEVSLDVAPTADILTSLQRPSPAPVMVGFAAETHDFLARGSAKLARKGLDLLFVNDVGRPDRGFAADTNAGWLLAAATAPQSVPLQSKAAIGELIVDRVVTLLANAAG